MNILEMYKVTLLAGRVDKRMWLLNRSGKIPFMVSCQGQEADQVGAAFALDREGVVKEAADRGRHGECPSVIETVSYRLTPHSSEDDDSTYRSAAEVAEAKIKDSIVTFGAYLKEIGILNDKLEKQINEELMDIVNEATHYAEGHAAMKLVYGDSSD